MPSPVTPDDFKALIPQASGSVCTAFKNALLRLPVLVYQLVKYIFNPDGTVSDAFRADIGVVGGGDGSSGGMTAPSGVDATDGDFDTKIVVTWAAVPNAAGYTVYRSEGDTPPTAPLATLGNVLTYEDFDIEVGTHYNYWVKVTNGTQTSGYSAPDGGYASPAGGGGAGTFTVSKNTNGTPSGISWKVPTGITSVNIKIWGAGAGGGGGGIPPFSGGVTTRYPGGGGGAGESRSITGLAVNDTQTLKLFVGKRGSGGNDFDDGDPGGVSQVKRSGSKLMEAFGGQGGKGSHGSGLPGKGGENGDGGSGGTATPGTNGTDGAVDGAGGSGGTPGLDGSGSGVGGNGGAQSTDGGGDGKDGRIEITW